MLLKSFFFAAVVLTSFTAIAQNQLTASFAENPRSLPLYGFNGNNTANSTNWQNTGLINRIQSMQIKVIRYPGGTISDWWDWRKGWFVNRSTNQSTKVNLPAKFLNKDIDVSDLQGEGGATNNLDDLKFLVDKTGAQVVFVVNMISSNVQDQIQMLQDAKSKGLNVKYIELGNEVNLRKSAGNVKYSGPKEYADTCKVWIDEIKKVFPQSECAVVGGNQNWDTKVTQWNRIVLSNVPNADAIVLHAYPALDSAGIGPKKLYDAVVNNFDVQGFDKIPGNIKIWITEYNIIWSAMRGHNPDRVRQFVGSWGQALGILLQTSTMTSISSQATIMLDHNLTGNNRFSAIETTNKTFNLLPNGIGMQAWLNASAGMNTLQKLTFKNGRGQAIPDYILFGWKFSDGTKNSVLLVNLTNNDIEANLSDIVSQPTMRYSTFSADKNQQINSLDDVTRKNGNTNRHITTPANSITIISM